MSSFSLREVYIPWVHREPGSSFCFLSSVRLKMHNESGKKSSWVRGPNYLSPSSALSRSVLGDHDLLCRISASWAIFSSQVPQHAFLCSSSLCFSMRPWENSLLSCKILSWVPVPYLVKSTYYCCLRVFLDLLLLPATC